ncbi:protein O-mannosyl-transferase family [Aquimarina sp. LLG6339-5]|uniref:protein O-mannosyl-transferase family n=1 Tax=Aquimarina sp. LLG6339-5 TaxID=3160830 RepID=UPI003868CD73
MNTSLFKKWNIILGWTVFTISLVVYIITAEPTNSFWDVGEYISASSKLQIGHPPGAPLFQMIGAFASLFATAPEQIAYTLNITSGIASAFTILFMFWSITLLLKNLVIARSNFTASAAITILGSAFTGSLAFAFTDSFWFNAVEAEVYAMATLILSVMFYLGLLWQRDMSTPKGNKWIILISFIIGLSFGVHFMGLLSIPAIGLLYYFKNYKTVTFKNFIAANSIVVATLLFIFKMLLPYTLTFFGTSEIFFVNSIGLPFHSGTIIAGISLIICFYMGLRYTRKKGYPLMNTSLLCILFILIGFSSWLMIPVRANAGTVINENNPNNARELLAYYNLEQYPKTHLFYGPQFSEIYGNLDKQEPYLDDKPKYEKDLNTKRYVIVNDWKNARQNLDNAHKTLLPRMWSTEHISNYMLFSGPLEFSVKNEYQDEQELIDTVIDFRKKYASGALDYDDYHKFLDSFGQFLDIKPPSFFDNVSYLFQYQINYMYWRYFMWNFVGRQDDVQGKLSSLHGNWLSGIPIIDESRLGSQNNLPTDTLNSKARNTYYFLPLILGLIGFVFHFQMDRKNFWVLLVFFLFTGLSLKIYLNERPFEPRERDYALVGSFYVFAIWIAFGVYALFDILKNQINTKKAAYLTLVISLLAAPSLLISQNWDDHDRSNRYTAQSSAKTYLSSCQKDAILFSIGDNDSFPLWYTQEIEGYRTDIRILITNLLATDWYVDQMKKGAYEGKPVPSGLEHSFYAYGNNDAIFFKEVTKDTMHIKNWMRWITSNDPRTKGELMNGKTVSTFPTKNIRIPVDKETVLKNGIVSEKDADKIVPYIDIHLKGNYIPKHRLVMLDIIANNNWERPIYFTGGSFGDDDYIWMKDYLQLDGMTYKLVPIKTKVNPNNPYQLGRVNTDIMYQNVKAWDWGNGDSTEIYHDPETRKNGISYRTNLGRLANQLIKENQLIKAEEILDLGIEKMPLEFYEYYTPLHDFINSYYQISKHEKARSLWKQVAKKYQEQLQYFANLSYENQQEHFESIMDNIAYYRDLIDTLVENKDTDLIDTEIDLFNGYIGLFPRFFTKQERPTLEDEENLLKELKSEQEIE